MNQHTADDILYTSRVGDPITELRKFGTELCLYTEDSGVFRRFSASKFCRGMGAYERAGQVYAHDLYFPRDQKARIIKMLKKQPSVAGKTEYFR